MLKILKKVLTRCITCVILQVLSKNTLQAQNRLLFISFNGLNVKKGASMDIATKVELSALHEIYGNSLTEKQQQVIDFCVLQDLSLGEVSDLLNISRQAVKYTLDNAVQSMLKLENKLNILAKFQNIKQQLTTLLKNTKDSSLKQDINKILEEL